MKQLESLRSRKPFLFFCLLLVATSSYFIFNYSHWASVQISHKFHIFNNYQGLRNWSNINLVTNSSSGTTLVVIDNKTWVFTGDTSKASVDSLTSTTVTSELETTTRANMTQSSLCFTVTSYLTGPLLMDSKSVTAEELVAKYPFIQNGRIIPQNCLADQRVALIIPFRNRSHHLLMLLNNLIPVLHRQLVDVTFFLVEQAPPTTFNRGALFNIGFLEAQKLGNFTCFIFHDVDMLPSNDRCLYRCGDNPRHFLASMNSRLLPYEDYFGGVVGMTREQYININGHSNLYFGWGGEDDDLLIRCRAKGYKFIRYPVTIGNYVSLIHKRDKGNEPNPDRFHLLTSGKKRLDAEGLTSVKYQLDKVETLPLYIRLYVQVNMTEILQTAPKNIKQDMIFLMKTIAQAA